MKINYKTKMTNRLYEGKVFPIEVINNLDEAIDQLCAELGDNPDPFAENLCPYFGILWSSAEALTQFLVENKDQLKNKKILEVGCGLGLPTIIAKYLGGNIIASDFHDDVEYFFKRNLRHNSLDIPFMKMDWCNPPKTLEKFDLILASDVLYESQHPKTLAQALKNLISKTGEIWLADPGRGYLQRFVDEMTGLGFKYQLFPITIEKDEIFVFKFSF